MFLLDTVVISEQKKRRPNAGASRWLSERGTSELFISVVTIGELERGIGGVRGRDPEFATVLASWLDDIVSIYGDRILPIGVGVARRWGQLSRTLGHRGVDLLIAATALEHGLTVVTRNTNHFAPTGVATLDPFAKVAD